MSDVTETTELSDPQPLGEERLEILRLVENGNVTSEEAARLLEALDRSERTTRHTHHDRGDQPTEGFTPGRPPGPPPPRPGPRNVRIRITDDGEAKLNLLLPYGLVDAGLKMAKRFAPENLLDSREIRDSVEQGFAGHLLDIVDGDQRVEIVVEGGFPGPGWAPPGSLGSRDQRLAERERARAAKMAERELRQAEKEVRRELSRAEREVRRATDELDAEQAQAEVDRLQASLDGIHANAEHARARYEREEGNEND